MRKAVIYARVSSSGDRQDTTRQVEDLTRYAAAAGLELVSVFEEKASGAKGNREVLADCIAFLRAGKADTLLLSELSRLGRNVRLILEVMDMLTQDGINIHILDLNIDTLLPDGKENPVAKMLLTVLGLGAELERKNIVSRLNSGRQLAIENGVQMGRPVGSGMSDDKFLEKYSNVAKRLKKGLSVRDTAAACGVSTFTVQKVKKLLRND
jgi:Site-specific recombinases, DNA invertase Pin homologs